VGWAVETAATTARSLPSEAGPARVRVEAIGCCRLRGVHRPGQGPPSSRQTAPRLPLARLPEREPGMRTRRRPSDTRPSTGPRRLRSRLERHEVRIRGLGTEAAPRAAPPSRRATQAAVALRTSARAFSPWARVGPAEARPSAESPMPVVGEGAGGAHRRSFSAVTIYGRGIGRDGGCSTLNSLSGLCFALRLCAGGRAAASDIHPHPARLRRKRALGIIRLKADVPAAPIARSAEDAGARRLSLSVPATICRTARSEGPE
jgi:hypothetical protein